MEGKTPNKQKVKIQTSKSRPNWVLTFSIFKSLTEGGIGGRVKEKVKPISKGSLALFWIGLEVLVPPGITWVLLFKNLMELK